MKMTSGATVSLIGGYVDGNEAERGPAAFIWSDRHGIGNLTVVRTRLNASKIYYGIDIRGPSFEAPIAAELLLIGAVAAAGVVRNIARFYGAAALLVG